MAIKILLANAERPVINCLRHKFNHVTYIHNLWSKGYEFEVLPK